MILPVASKIEAPVNIQAKAVQVGVGLSVGALGCLCSVILTKYWFGGACLWAPVQVLPCHTDTLSALHWREHDQVACAG